MASVVYHEATLYEEDIEVLSKGWLTSNCIDFYFNYLEHDLFKDLSLSKHGILLMNPATIFIISMADDVEELESSLEPLNLRSQRLVLLPINNETNTGLSHGTRGTHWSLLVFDRDTMTFTHWDSFRRNNVQAAKRAASRLEPFLGSCGEATCEISWEETVEATQQKNGSDCGVYVCCNARRVVQRKMNVTPDFIVTQETVDQTRDFMAKLAKENKKKK